MILLSRFPDMFLISVPPTLWVTFSHFPWIYNINEFAIWRVVFLSWTGMDILIDFGSNAHLIFSGHILFSNRKIMLSFFMRFCIIVNVIIHVLLQATSSGLIFENNSKFLFQYLGNITSYIIWYRMSCIIHILSQSQVSFITLGCQSLTKDCSNPYPGCSKTNFDMTL
jgi:hypothetical protein